MCEQTSAQAAATDLLVEGDSSAAAPSPAGDFDPARAQVPIICKDCDKEFAVPYRHFQVGVVFHCPHCHGSFVPRLPIYHAVRDKFEAFFEKRRRASEQFAANAGDATIFQRQQAAEFDELHRVLLELARSIHPAGKLVRRKGFGAMFT